MGAVEFTEQQICHHEWDGLYFRRRDSIERGPLAMELGATHRCLICGAYKGGEYRDGPKKEGDK